ncbi:hypothetical protein CYMTET_12419 [Cymbomonas tetramitiformis]|uniref:Right handed beta helix domain-containing protein n=1 Tax=Cymbomonas tetramitiformis TaxID=36881 RepID=A0AAE0LCG4_9CHLO|nr:hypothetical protein CYMTET_12419 [Cymbomonas tetramitiformis]
MKAGPRPCNVRYLLLAAVLGVTNILAACARNSQETHASSDPDRSFWSLVDPVSGDFARDAPLPPRSPEGLPDRSSAAEFPAFEKRPQDALPAHHFDTSVPAQTQLRKPGGTGVVAGQPTTFQRGRDERSLLDEDGSGSHLDEDPEQDSAEAAASCSNSCIGLARDGYCDDGRAGAHSALCACGTDCDDCGGPRNCTATAEPCVTNGEHGDADAGTPCHFYDGFRECAEYGGEHGAHGYCATSRGYMAQWGSCAAACDALREPEAAARNVSDGVTVNGSVANVNVTSALSSSSSFEDLYALIKDFAGVMTVVLHTDVVVGPEALPVVHRSLVLMGQCGEEGEAGLCGINGSGHARLLELAEGGLQLRLERLALRGGAALNQNGGALLVGTGSAALLQDCILEHNAARSGRCENSCAQETEGSCDDGGTGAWPGSSVFCPDDSDCSSEGYASSLTNPSGDRAYCPLGTDCKDCGLRYEGGHGGAVYAARDTLLSLQRSLDTAVHGNLASSATAAAGDGLEVGCADNTSYRWVYGGASYNCEEAVLALQYDLLLNMTHGMPPRGCADLAQLANQSFGVDNTVFTDAMQMELVESCPLACGVCPTRYGCSDTCIHARNGNCDDGGTHAEFGLPYQYCELGTDCSDCSQDVAYGGGVYLEGEARLTAVAGNIHSNAVLGHGGGLYGGERAAVRLEQGSVVKGNVGSGSGAGVHLGVTGGHLALDGESGIMHNTAGMDGGGVYVAEGGSLEVAERARIANNTAGGDGGGLWLGAEGAAWLQGGCVVEGNSATSGLGGGLYTDRGAGVVVDAGVVRGNTARRGGALANLGSNVTLRNATGILWNTALESGGGVLALEATAVLLEASLLSGNTAVEENGGGVYAGPGTALRLVQGVELSNNSAGGDGAGMYLSEASVDMEEASSSTNGVAGGSGGGLFAGEGCHVAIRGGSHVTGNQAGKHGGGMHLTDSTDASSSSLLLEGSSVASNTAARDGGGVWAGSLSAVEVRRGAQIVDNSAAGDGGGLRVAHTAVLSDANVTGNVAEGAAGGVCGAEGSRVDVVASVVNRNRAMRGDGGGLEVQGELHLEASVVEGNAAPFGSGGGAYAAGQVVQLLGARLTENHAGGGGGGIYVAQSAALSVNGTVVTDNSCEGSGGGVHGTHVAISGGHVAANTAGGSGGGIAVAKYGRLAVEGASSVETNYAGQGGGLYCAEQTATWLTEGSAVMRNTAYQWGGGISVAGSAARINASTLAVSGSEVSLNLALRYSGGGIAASNFNNITCVDTLFYNNTALVRSSTAPPSFPPR